jgi:hypothetical protein
MPPKSRPRDYATLDREYLNQDTVRDLGEQFGPDGPLVLLALILEAGKVTSATEPGQLDLRFSSVARDTFTVPGRVREIVDALVPLGLLADYSTPDGVRFRGRMVKFPRWESVPMSDADRKAKQRLREIEESGHESHGQP